MTTARRRIITGLSTLALVVLSHAAPAQAEDRRCYCRTNKNNFSGADNFDKIDPYFCGDPAKWFYIGDKGSQGDCNDYCQEADEYGRDAGPPPYGLWTNKPICDWQMTYVSDSKFGYTCSPIDSQGACQQGCYCRYGDDDPVVSCRGLTFHSGVTVALSQTGDSAECQQICANDFEVTGAKSVELGSTRCNFRKEDLCGSPAVPFAISLSDTNEDGKQYTHSIEVGLPYILACKQELISCYCRYPADYFLQNCQTLPMLAGSIVGPGEETRCRNLCAALKHDGKEPFVYYKTDAGLVQDVCYYDGALNRCDSPFLGVNHPACKDAEFLKELTDKRTSDEIARIQEFEKKYANVQGSTVSLPLPLGAKSPQAAVGRIIKQIFGVVGGLALGMFVYAGFLWMTAAGNPDKVKKAKATVVWASIGLVTLFASYAIVNFIIQSLA